ncbi:MAG TPA: hypothetical protein ENL46_05585, partial [Candidatus Aminicenantes bacterium]|nr:hypothetical protein [Candidatus Aminicenantes bacterium]
MLKKVPCLCFFLLLFVSLFSCSSSKESRSIHNKIALRPDGRLPLIKKIRAEEGKIDFYLHDSDGKDCLAVVMHDENNKRKVVLFNRELEKTGSFILPQGKGPGELGSWIPGMGMDGELIYFIDRQKNSIEMFTHEGHFEDSIPIQDSSYSLSFGNCVVTRHGDNFYVGMTYPGSVVKTDSQFNALGRASKEKELDVEKIFESLVRYTTDASGYVYTVMLGIKGAYEIRKYDPGMNLVKTAYNDDGLNDLLSFEKCQFPDNSFEVKGGAPAISLCVKGGKLYVLRGVAGINDIKWEGGKKVFYGLPIPGLEKGFVDIFDAETLKHIK